MAFAATARVEPRTPRGPSRCREGVPVRRRCARRPIACEPYRNPAARTVASIPRPSARNRSGPSGCSHTSMSRRISLRPVRLQSDNRAHPVRSGLRRAQAHNPPGSPAEAMSHRRWPSPGANRGNRFVSCSTSSFNCGWSLSSATSKFIGVSPPGRQFGPRAPSSGTRSRFGVSACSAA